MPVTDSEHAHEECWWMRWSFSSRCEPGTAVSPQMYCCFQSLSHVRLLQPHRLQNARLPCPSPSPGVCSNSCPLSRWTISTSVASSPQSFPASGSFPMSRLFISGGQSIGASASVSVLLMNIQGWFPLELTGLIFLLSKKLSRVFSSTTVNLFDLNQFDLGFLLLIAEIILSDTVEKKISLVLPSTDAERKKLKWPSLFSFFYTTVGPREDSPFRLLDVQR